jgi:hypothetical protein
MCFLKTLSGHAITIIQCMQFARSLRIVTFDDTNNRVNIPPQTRIVTPHTGLSCPKPGFNFNFQTFKFSKFIFSMYVQLTKNNNIYQDELIKYNVNILQQTYVVFHLHLTKLCVWCSMKRVKIRKM